MGNKGRIPCSRRPTLSSYCSVEGRSSSWLGTPSNYRWHYSLQRQSTHCRYSRSHKPRSIHFHRPELSSTCVPQLPAWLSSLSIQGMPSSLAWDTTDLFLVLVPFPQLTVHVVHSLQTVYSQFSKLIAYSIFLFLLGGGKQFLVQRFCGPLARVPVGAVE